MSEQCVNSFVDSLEDLIEDSEFVAPNFTDNQDAFSLLKEYAKTVIHATIASKCGSPEEYSENIDLYKFLISGMLTFITSMVGTMGNILSIITLLHRNMRNVFNLLLATLCMADMLVILTNLVFSINTIYPNNLILSSLLPWSDGLCHIAVTASVFLTIAITVERYYAVWSPYAYRTRVVERGHWWILSSYIMPVMLTATMLNLPKLLHLIKADFVKNMFKHHQATYIKLGIIFQVVHPLATTSLVPVIVLCLLNYRMFIGAKRTIANSTTDISMARIMMTIVAVFILLSMPKVILALFEVSTIPDILDCHQRTCRYYVSSARWVADSIIRYLVMLNSSTNFIIYCFFGSNFRRTLLSSMKSLLGKNKRPSHNVVHVTNETNFQCEETQTASHLDTTRGIEESELKGSLLQVSEC